MRAFSCKLLFRLKLPNVNRLISNSSRLIGMSNHLFDQAPSGDDAALTAAAERIQATGVLGESRVRRLFDYLLTTSLAGQSPKEIAIAMDVFGKGADFDVGNDALVRVYIHKLRKVLDEFYSSSVAKDADLIHMPRGEYRLRVTPKPVALVAAAALEVPGTINPINPAGAINPAGDVNKRRRPVLIAAFLGALVLTVLAVLWMRMPHSDLERVRANPIWSAILKDDRPIMIIIGDYYLIGELDASMEIKRLVREYSVNSKSDLDSYVAEHPEAAERYMDVGIRYLPISAASALRDVMVVLAPENRRITVSKMSDLEAGSLKSADIVYIGYLSGMGMFQDLTFAGSRFTVGESYDEIIDKSTKHSYVSDVGSQIMDPPKRTGKQERYHDYGMFTKFRGPGGNSVVVISGTRDEGVSQTAEVFTNAQKLEEISRQVDLAMPIEALLDVSAFDGVSLTGRPLVTTNRKDPLFR
jgi:hypothetical protein